MDLSSMAVVFSFLVVVFFSVVTQPVLIFPGHQLALHPYVSVLSEPLHKFHTQHKQHTEVEHLADPLENLHFLLFQNMQIFLEHDLSSHSLSISQCEASLVLGLGFFPFVVVLVNVILIFYFQMLQDVVFWVMLIVFFHVEFFLSLAQVKMRMNLSLTHCWMMNCYEKLLKNLNCLKMNYDHCHYCSQNLMKTSPCAPFYALFLRQQRRCLSFRDFVPDLVPLYD